MLHEKDAIQAYVSHNSSINIHRVEGGSVPMIGHYLYNDYTISPLTFQCCVYRSLIYELTVDPVCCSHRCYSTRCESIDSTQFAARCCHHRPQQEVMSWGRSCRHKQQDLLVLRKFHFHYNTSARSDSISDQHPSVRGSRIHRSTSRSMRDIDHLILNEAKQFLSVLYSMFAATAFLIWCWLLYL